MKNSSKGTEKGKGFLSLFRRECPVLLAPMAGITDHSFRILCKEMGADGLVTEMISAKALHYGNKNTIPLLAYEECEHPIGVQLFGSEPELMARMACLLEEKGFDYIDINMGCPVPKVVNNAEGSALMLDPARAGRIVAAIVSAVGIPVTVKFRKGFDSDHVNAVEFAGIMEEKGASAICVHGRTREQFYAGRADWETIRQVKEAVRIPVIGNGDVFSGKEAAAMRDYCGVDAIMVGRGAKGNPWIFREIRETLDGKPVTERPSKEEVIRMILRHAELSVEEKGEKIAILEMRKHTAWYTAGMRDSAALRKRVNQVTTLEELKELFMR